MIECSTCESPQFLHITKSRVYFDSDTEKMNEVYEEYRCLWCGSEGSYNRDDRKETGRVTITGDVRETDVEVPTV